MKIKHKTKNYRLFVKVKASRKEIYDVNELNRFARESIRGFLKPIIKNKKTVECSGPIGITLHERLKKGVTKRDFLYIIEYIVMAARKLRNKNFALNHLILDIDNVYINETTKEVLFLFLPLTEPNGQVDLLQFIETIMYSAISVEKYDTEFLTDFALFFKHVNIFDEKIIESYIYSQDKSIVNVIKKNTSLHNLEISNKKNYSDFNQCVQVDREDLAVYPEYEEDTGLLEDEEATGLLDEECTGLLEEDDDLATGLLNEDCIQPYKYPSIIRQRTNEKILVDKPVFRIGKEQSCVDYFVNNNPSVSRAHADIVTRNNMYFVVDRNSKNKTYINGKILYPEIETQIYDNDNLRLANEDFVFSI